MSDYGEKLLRLLVAETHCLTVLVAAQGTGRSLRDLSDEDREKLEMELAQMRVGYTNLLTPNGVDDLLTPIPGGSQSIH